MKLKIKYIGACAGLWKPLCCLAVLNTVAEMDIN